MMIRYQNKGELSEKSQLRVACSGGVDSMVSVDFLRRRKDIIMMFFNHGTGTSKEALEFIQDFSNNNNNDDVKLEIASISRKKDPSESWEEYWRIERYKWFNSFDVPVITCHHLDDCVENWIATSLHGNGVIIPYLNKNVFRPFRLNRKSTFLDWAEKNKLEWVEDKSNKDLSFTRNYIRYELLPRCLKVNPGLYKTIMKKVLREIN